MSTALSPLNLAAVASPALRAVLVEPPAEVQSLEDEFGGRSDQSRVALCLQLLDGRAHALELQSLTCVFHRGHIIRHLDGGAGVERRQQRVEFLHEEIAVEDGQNRGPNQFLNDPGLVSLADSLELDLA